MTLEASTAPIEPTVCEGVAAVSSKGETAARLRALSEGREARIDALRALLGSIRAGARPMTLELCCGHGHFLANLAAERPELFHLGIDYCRERIARAERKQERSGRDNLRFIRAEVFEFLEAWPGDHAVSEVFILFPDPWPKRKHHKNRVFSARLLARLSAIGAPGAKLFFRTDSDDYFQQARRLGAQSPDWLAAGDEPWPLEYATIFQQKAKQFASLALVKRREGKEPARPATGPRSTRALA